MTEVIITV